MLRGTAGEEFYISSIGKTEIPRNATEQGKGGVLVPFCLIILANGMGLYLPFSPVLR